MKIKMTCGCTFWNKRRTQAGTQVQFEFLVLVAVAVGFISFSSGVADGIFLARITSPDKDEIARNSSSQVVFNCSVTSGGPVKFFLWKKDGKVVRRSESGVAQYWSALVKSSVNQSDAGVYECIAGDGRENQTDVLTLHINYKPNIIYGYGKHTTTPQFLSVNDIRTFYCHARGWPKPHFRWLKNGVQIKQIKYVRELEEKMDGLDLSFPSGVAKTDSGNYTCEATNIFGVATYSIAVDVQDDPPSLKPRIRPENREVTSTVGSSKVTLTCFGEYTQKELTTTYWVFNNTDIDDNKASARVYYENHFHDQRVKTSLVIQNVTLADDGNYTCGVSTPVDHSEEFVYLRVKEARKTHTSGGITWILVAAAVSSAVGILLFVLLLLLYRSYKRRTKYTMLTEKYDIDGKTYKYDAFLTYSSHNVQWVESNVVPLLEEHNLEYCLHYRNFEPGKAIAENMAESVYCSRKVIVIMSRYYMSSNFCREELDIALYRCLERGDSCIIVIRIDDIKISSLPKSLRNKTLLDLRDSKEQLTWQKRLLDHVKVPSEMTNIRLPLLESCVSQDSNANVQRTALDTKEGRWNRI